MNYLGTRLQANKMEYGDGLILIIGIDTFVRSQANLGLFGGEYGHISSVVITYVNRDEIPDVLDILHFMHIVIF